MLFKSVLAWKKLGVMLQIKPSDESAHDDLEPDTQSALQKKPSRVKSKIQRRVDVAKATLYRAP